MTDPGPGSHTQSASGTSIRVIPFGKYLLLERIAVGGMAEVFLAKPLSGKDFADLVTIKRIVPALAGDPEFIRMFVDEAKIAGHLRHANIVTLYELGKLGDSHYMALEHISGKDSRQLIDRLRRQGRSVPPEMVALIASKLCDALDYAHDKRSSDGMPLNLVHRDVSPQNILLSYDGQVKIIDFGVAKAALQASRTQAGVLKGKLGYMSPEHTRGLPVDCRSDLFALGICMHELLTGRHLFVGSTDVETLDNVRHADVPPPSATAEGIPGDLDHIVTKALSKRPDDRWQSAGEMQTALHRFLAGRRHPFGARQLASWVQTAFAGEMKQERSRLAVYRAIGAPPETSERRSTTPRRGPPKPALDAYTVELAGDVGTDTDDGSVRSDTGESSGDRTAVSGPPSFDGEPDRDPTIPEAKPPAAMDAEELRTAAEDADAPETIYFRADNERASSRPPARQLPRDEAPAGHASAPAPAAIPEPATRPSHPSSETASPGDAARTRPSSQRKVPTMKLQAMDVRQVAAAAAAAEPAAASTGDRSPPAPRGRRRARRRILAGGLVAAVLVLTGLTAWHVADGRRGGTTPPVATGVSGDPTPSPRERGRPSAPPAEGSRGTGTLVINSMPWAHVYLDGRDTGEMTPVRHLEVPAGPHTIGLKRSDGRMQEWSIEVEAGETVRVIKQLDAK